MRKRLSNLIHAGMVLTAVTAGAAMLAPAARAQTSPAPEHKKSAAATSSHGHSSSLSHPSTTTGTGKEKSATKTSGSKSAKGTNKKPGKTRKVKGQAAPTPERINEIQEALAKHGVYSGEPTGRWDDSTSDAMRTFQSRNHLNPTGKLDAPTLQKLGLGSETAGLAAPTPPPSSVANRLLSKNAQKDPEPSDDN